MMRRALAVILTLAMWVGGTLAGSIGSAPPAGAQPMLTIGRAHADYVPVMDGTTPIFILLIGSDSRPGTETVDGRADSLHILGINPAKHRATLYGIPRDSYVPLASGGSDKINAAMPAGGVDAEIATVENLTGITMDYYAITRFEGFIAATQSVGGIEVDVPLDFEGYLGTNFVEGPMEVAGKYALEFARTRHSLARGDFQRSFNQGVAVQGAISTFKHAFAEDPSSLYRWMGASLRNIQTSLSIGELTDLAMLATKVPAKNVTNLVAIGTIGTAGSMSIVNLTSDNTALWQDMAADGYILTKDIPAAAGSS